MNKVKCVRCGKQYMEKEIDPYYCPECLINKQQQAEEIDKKIANNPKRKTISDLQQFDAIAKQKGGGAFVNIRDLGISL